MFPQRRSPVACCVLLVQLAATSLATADPLPPASECAEQRAGNPHSVAWWAVPSDTGSYVGYLVGGGCPFPHRADPPLAIEGTWGWDYQGWLLRRRVILGWWHDRRYQGGTGAYKADGPQCISHTLESEADSRFSGQ